jgi:hypothetical protein
LPIDITNAAIFFFSNKSERNVSLSVILLGIGTGIDTGNVVDLANLDFVHIDMSRVPASTLTLTPNPNPT